MNFYTNVAVFGSKILYRGVENGRRTRKKLDYFPTLYTPSNGKTNMRTLFGEYLAEVKPGTIRECRDFVKQYEGVSGFEIYGMQRYEYAFIGDNFKELTWDKKLINVCNIDIEVGSENGFPDPITASEPVTAITYKMKDKFIVFGCGDYTNSRGDVTYIKCQDEEDLLKRFLNEWVSDYPDIITGWYIKFFDIPYLVNRLTNLFGEAVAKRLSPWNYLAERNVYIQGKERHTYVPSGIAVLDCMELYRKFAPGGASQESYKLDAIAHVELGKNKLSYEEYGSLHSLYRDNYQKFIDYNIRDVELVEMLDHKHKLIDLAIYLAYHFRVNFEDVFQQVRMWDAGIYNKLASMGISIPQNRRTPKKEQYVGAYVKAPQTGMHHCVASFDLNSLYPHLIMQYNIGPDTIVEAKDYSAEMMLLIDENVTVDKLLNKEIDTSCLKANKVTLTPNGQFFTVGKRGFLAEMMEDMYNSRSAYKKKSIDAKKLLEKETDPLRREEIENTIAHYNTLQMAMKVSLNSAYGALGNEYFRFFDVRQASAITTSGQLAIQWIEKKLNGYLNKLLSTNNRDYVIASDTDSVYLTLDELVRKTFAGSNETNDPRKTIAFMDRVCEIKLQPFINKSYEELAEYTNALTQKMQMKRESLADKGLWTAKKRYVLNVYNVEGVEYAKPKIKVTGLEMIKSSTPAACREKLWEALDILLNKNEETMIDFIEQFRKDFRTLPILDIAFPRGMNNLEEYSEEGNTSESLFDEEKFTTAGNKTPIHVRGAIVYNELLRSKKLSKKYPTIKEGEKLKFIYLKQPNIIRSNVISLPQIVPTEFGLEKIIDYDLQFEKSFLEPLKVLLNLIDWKTEQTNTLEAFFG